MGELNSIPIVYVCIVGGIYSFFLLGECYVRWKARRGNRTGSPRSIWLDWWGQAISAIAFLAVAAMMIGMTRVDFQPDRGGSNDHDNLVPRVQIPDFLPVSCAHLYRREDRPGQPIWGANLAFLPVTDVDLRALLKEGAEIEFLVLTGTDITDEGLAYLRRMPGLKDLGLTGTQVTDGGCRELAQIGALQELSLSNTKITDDGLEHLSKLTNLRTLELARTAITDRGLKSLRKLDRLQFLNITETNVTAQGVRDLKKRMPHLACCGPG